jgi:N-methylhydantoinase B
MSRSGNRRVGGGGLDMLADPIAMEVFSNRLLSITEDIGNTLVRSSFSPNIKERKDCSVALFDGAGRLVAQASHVPLHLASLMGSVKAVLRRYGNQGIQPGDAFICNDPHETGGSHLPDISVINPVVVDGRVRFFAANVGHHSDVGGRVPGSIAGDCRTIFEEGLRLPVMRMARAGEIDEDILALVGLNSRSREERILDLKVQIASNVRGVSLLEALIARMGDANVARAVDDLLAYTARRLRNRLAAVPDGTASATSQLDDDGLGGDPVPIKATATVEGDRLIVDFAGTGKAARGAMNMVESALQATVYYCVKTALDPGLLPNNGMFEGIEIRTEPGSLVSPDPSRAVGARSITCNMVSRAILGALGQLLPKERAMAAGMDVIPATVFSGPSRSGFDSFVYVETVGGGSGGRAGGDGMDAVHVHMTNTSNLPIEALENEYPLRMVEYGMVENSGGAGTHRGGLGIAREIMAVEDGVVFSARSDGHEIGAPGMAGGGRGTPGHLWHIAPDGSRRVMSSKAAQVELKMGESIRLETPGGGGYGAPSKRDPALLAADIRGGKFSEAAARAAYGDALVDQALAVGEGR